MQKPTNNQVLRNLIKYLLRFLMYFIIKYLLAGGINSMNLFVDAEMY